MIDFIDFYILGPDDPTYNPNYIVQDDIISVIIQKYKTILFTNKGDVLGDPFFGADLELLLFETKVSEEYVTTTIVDQINNYIPELITMNYTLKVVFEQDPNNYQDIMYIYFNIADYEVYAQFGKSIT
jgi:hypothetical protein